MEPCLRCDRELKKYDQFATIEGGEVEIECYNCFYDIDEDEE